MLPLDHEAALERIVRSVTMTHWRVTTRIIPDPPPVFTSDHFTDMETDAVREHLAAYEGHGHDVRDGRRRETTYVALNARGEEIRGVPV